MHDRREINAEIFKDTEYMYKSNKKLKNAVSNSLREQRLILETEEVSAGSNAPPNGKIVVSGKRTLDRFG